ncbi:hypothetical protein HPP92_022655 [Vanilla planifolia]|uniref:Uncharacterized protein n=1 Tax=Vanilla planifolia TaxID=51239 RepID=A0A835PRA8_VANPL|nr:hypothetical protein HPP92_022655 [Vanilla planifolia]
MQQRSRPMMRDRSSESMPYQTEAMEGSCKLESGNHKKFQGDMEDDGLKRSEPYHSTGKGSFINPEKCETSACNSSQEKLSAEEFSVTFVPSASALEPPSPKDHMNNSDQCIISAVQNDDQISAEVNMSKCVPLVLGQGENVDVLSPRVQIVSSPAKSPIEMHATSSNGSNVESEEGNRREFVPAENNPELVVPNHPESPKQSSLGKHIAEGIHDLWIDGSLGSNELTENTNEVKELCNERTLKPCKEGDALKCSDPYKTSNFTADLDSKSVSEGDSVEFDALEVARQVAIQVEREVVDYREQSSSPEVSSRDVDSTASHDIENMETNHSMGGEPNADASVNVQDVWILLLLRKQKNANFRRIKGWNQLFKQELCMNPTLRLKTNTTLI